jgi:hypothetical protein
MMAGRVLRIGVWGGLGLALPVVAYLLVNTTFMPYDDEGYVLISLRNYLSGLRLYDDVFSQYGPWPYVYHWLITTGLQSPMTHALGRALTVFHWVATSLLCGALGWQLSRSQLAAYVSATLSFGLCWQNTSEPSHPGSHITLLVALGAVMISRLPGNTRPWGSYTGLGVIMGLLLLTKINVGLLFAASLGCYVLYNTRWPGQWPQAARLLAAAGLLAVPWVLLFRQLGQSWVLVLAIQFTLAVLGLLWLAPPAQTGARLSDRAWIAVPGASLLAGGLVCLLVWQHGTGLQTLFQAVLIDPIRMPTKFLVGLTWYPEVWLLALAGAIAVFKAGREFRNQGRLTPFTMWAILGIRVAGLAALVIFAPRWPSYTGVFHFSAYCLPLLPVFVVPLTAPAASPQYLGRWGVACLALPQVLHLFPVAGSQLAWATFLCLPVMVAGVFDLREALPRLLPGSGRGLVVTGGIALFTAATIQFALLAHTGWQRYVHSRPLDLPGAENIRLDGPTRQAFRLLNLNARIHATLLFSRQGMYSHNLWSGVPTPTAQNATHWFWLLPDTQQREIIARLKAARQTALITSHSLDAFMVKQNIAVSGPLQDFLVNHYRSFFSYGDFSFHVPADSRAIVFGRHEFLESATDPDRILYRSCLLLDGRPAHIRLEPINSSWDMGPELLTGQFQAFAEPIDREGRTTGAPVPLPATQPLRGLYRLSVLCPRLPPKLPWQDYVVIVSEADGTWLAESVR